MDTITTANYIDALQKVIEKRYSPEVFSANGYQECAICIQYLNGKWSVYNAERGNRYDEVVCDTVLKACLEVIRKLTHRIEDISAMESELLSTIYSQRIA